MYTMHRAACLLLTGQTDHDTRQCLLQERKRRTQLETDANTQAQTILRLEGELGKLDRVRCKQE